MDRSGPLDSSTGRVKCFICIRVGLACPEILLQEHNQGLCLKFQGWSKEVFGSWRCPNCTISSSGVSGPEQPRPELLRCRHGSGAVPLPQEGVGPGVPNHELPPPPAFPAPPGLGRQVPPPPPSPAPPSQHPWPPLTDEARASCMAERCESDACRGCLAVCAACTRWLQQPYTCMHETNQLRTLTCEMNMLPVSCIPAFLLTQDEQEIRGMANQLPQGMDHGKQAGSVLMLVMMRPHLYMLNPVPLRLFGYPAPATLLAVDANPHSGVGPDNKRSNLLEALCAYWLQLPDGQHILRKVQQLWHLMSLGVSAALRESPLPRPVNSHRALRRALMVGDMF